MFSFFPLRTALFIRILVFFIIISAVPKANALNVFDLEKGRTVYGTLRTVKAGRQQTLLDIAKNYDLGYNQIVAANPGVDPWVPSEGASVIVPNVFVLPGGRLPSGIVINLAEMRPY